MPGKGDTEVLSDDLVTCILFAVARYVPSVVMACDGHELSAWPLFEITPRARHNEGLYDILACRLVSSRWRVLCAKPLQAAALASVSLDLEARFGLFLCVEYGQYLRSKLAEDGTASEHLCSLFQNGIHGGLRVSPRDRLCEVTVFDYFRTANANFHCAEGPSRALIVCSPGQLQSWLGVATRIPDLGGYTGVVAYTGNRNMRKQLREDHDSGTLFVATFSDIIDEMQYDLGEDQLLNSVLSCIIDSRSVHGLALCNSLLEVQDGGNGTTRLLLASIDNDATFRQAWMLIKLIFPPNFVEHTHLARFIERAECCCLGDESTARWAIDKLCTSILLTVASKFFRRLNS